MIRPSLGPRSPAIVSSRVPATWIVPARRTSGLVQGTGSDRIQSILNTPGAVVVARHPAPVALVHPVAGHRHEGLGGGVEQDGRDAVELAQVGDVVPGHHLAALLLERGHHRVGELLRAALDQRPADVVGQHRRAACPSADGERLGEVEHPVRGGPADQRPRPLRLEVPVGQPAHVGQPVEPEVRDLRRRSSSAAGAAGWSGRSRRRRCRARPAGRTAGGRPPRPAPSPAAVSSRERRGDRRPTAVERVGEVDLRAAPAGRRGSRRSNSRKNGAAAAIGCTVEQTSWR